MCCVRVTKVFIVSRSLLFSLCYIHSFSFYIQSFAERLTAVKVFFALKREHLNKNSEIRGFALNFLQTVDSKTVK